MSQSLRIVWLLSVAITGGTVLAAESRVGFKNNRLKVDGKPFFIYGCWGTPNSDYAKFRRRYFNTAFMSWKASVTEGPKAAAEGLMVIPYPYAPSWNEKVREAMQSIRNEDWVLAWNIGDDLSKEEHIQAALKVRDAMRAIDPQGRPIMFDAIGRYEDFAKIPDMWCAYAYALVKSPRSAPPARKPAGLREYGDWLNRMRLLGRQDCFFWTWAQCHVQIWYSLKYLGGVAKKDHWRPSRFPDGDHLRLVAAHAISAGCRGLLWFVHYYFQGDHIGCDRYARAGVIGCQLDVVGPLIAQGKTGERLKTSDPSVWATPIDFPGGRLICLVKTGDRYNYQPDAAEANDIGIETGARGKAYQIGLEFKELRQPRCSFHLATWLLVTKDDALVARLRERHRAVLPDMARFVAEELEARIAKMRPVFGELRKGGSALRQARQRLDRARRHIEEKGWVEAGRLTEEGLTVLRTAQHRVWSETWSDDVLAMGLKLTDFYILPSVARDIELLKRDAWGPNHLQNGSFESDAGWGGAKLAHDTKGKAALISGAGRTGSRALRLASDSRTIYKGEPQDWVTANVVSDRIPAKPNEIWEIAAWVRVPKRLEQTGRGITIALFAYDTDGKSIPGYGAQALEAAQVEATQGWQRVRLVVPLRSSGITAVAARLAICGIGEAYLDDVTVRRLEESKT